MHRRTWHDRWWNAARIRLARSAVGATLACMISCGLPSRGQDGLEALFGPEQKKNAAQGQGRKAEPDGGLGALANQAAGVAGDGTAAGDAPAGTALKTPRDAPPQADIDAAAARIRDVYDEDIGRAGQPQHRSRVVAMFLECSSDETLSPAEAYATLQLAAEIAAHGDDLKAFNSVIRSFTASFKGVDADARLLEFLTNRDQQKKAVTKDFITAALALNERLRLGKRYREAEAAADLAGRFLEKVGPQKMAADLRDAVADAKLATRDEADLAAAAKAAYKALEADPHDESAHLPIGLYAALRNDWEEACAHLQQCSRDDLRTAAEKEVGAAPDPRAMCEAANAWWKIASRDLPAADAGDVPTVAPMPTPIRRSLRMHAADLYERALANGVKERLLRDEATKNLAEVRPKPRDGQGDQRKIMPEPPPAVFDRARFDDLERERSDQWRRFQQAVRKDDRDARDRAIRELTRIRPQWCEVLAPWKRDGAPPERRAALRAVIGHDGRSADLHLCESYLHMLAGERDEAKASLDESLALIQENAAEQVFCPRQLLDLACAAVILRDLPAANRINNSFLRKKFPNDPSVLEVQALLFLAQTRFGDAIEKLRDAHRKTKDADQARIAAQLAWVLAAAPADAKQRMPAEAERFADEAIRVLDGAAWRAWRAKAELRASEKNWDAALTMLGKAESQAPLLYGDELNRQRQCYREKRSYEIERE